MTALLQNLLLRISKRYASYWHLLRVRLAAPTVADLVQQSQLRTATSWHPDLPEAADACIKARSYPDGPEHLPRSWIPGYWEYNRARRELAERNRAIGTRKLFRDQHSPSNCPRLNRITSDFIPSPRS